MDIRNGVILALLEKLQAILSDRPLIIEVLKSNLPKNINLQTLLEILESINGKAIPDVEIREFLTKPSKGWKDSIYKNQSASVDVSVARHRATDVQLVKLFKAKANNANEKVLLDMMEFSQEMEKIMGTLYKHNGYQSTVTASVVALDKKCTYVKLPTSSGKTYVGGMLGLY